MPTLFGDPIDMTSGYFVDELTAFSIKGASKLGLDMRYASGRYLVEGHHTTVAFKMLGKDNAMNMNTATNDLPSATNVYWTKNGIKFGERLLRLWRISNGC